MRIHHALRAAAGYSPVAGGGSSHTFWRVLVTLSTAGTSGYRLKLEELEFLGAGDEDFVVTVGGTGFASTASNQNLYGADKLYDRDPVYYYQNDYYEPNPLHMGFEFNSAVEVTSLAITTDDDKYSPEDFELQYSDDGSTWTTVWSITGVARGDWTDGERKVWSVV